MIYRRTRNALCLIHPVHGILKRRMTDDHNDSVAVMLILNQWKKIYGKAYLQCTTEWEEPIKPENYIHHDFTYR